MPLKRERTAPTRNNRHWSNSDAKNEIRKDLYKNALIEETFNDKGVFYYLICVFLFGVKFGKCLRELIGAGGGLEAALDSFQSGNSLVNAHSNEQTCNALRVSCAAAGKLYGGYNTALYVNVYLA